MTTASPTVSVVIPCYNAAARLPEVLGAALGQTLEPLEVVVVDDGSTDGSADLAAAFGGPVRVLGQRNAGAGAARAAGVRAARGDFVAFCDADDPPPPRKLEILADGLTRHADAAFSLGRTAPPGGGAADAGGDDRRPVWEPVPDPLREILGRYFPLVGAMNLMARRSAAVRATDGPPFPPAGNDYDFQLRLSLQGPAVRTEALTCRYEPGAGGLSRSHGLPRQSAYALLAASRVVAELSPDRRAELAHVWRRRVEAEWAWLYTHVPDRRLAAAAARAGLRAARWRTVPRRLFWALDELDPAARSLLPAVLRSAYLTGRFARGAAGAPAGLRGRLPRAAARGPS